MANFGERIKALTGLEEISNIGFLANQWLNDAIKDIINVLPPQVLYIASDSVNLSQWQGTTTPESRVLEVVRWGGNPRIENECKEIDSALRGKYTPTSGYMEEATDDSPVFWRRKNAIRVLPDPTGEDYATITYVNYPSIVYTQSSISKFPNEVEQLVALKAAVTAKFYQIGLANQEEDLEVATSHTNHMSALNQEYTMCLQNFMSGFQMNAKEQGAV